MKIRINKEFTENWQIERVQSDAKEFKARYTDGDVLRAFQNATEDYRTYNADIIYMNVSAMDAGSYYDNQTIFCVDVMTESITRIFKIRYYVDMKLNVMTDANLITVREYDENIG